MINEFWLWFDFWNGFTILSHVFIWDGILSTSDYKNKIVINIKMLKLLCSLKPYSVKISLVCVCMCWCVCAGTCMSVHRKNRGWWWGTSQSFSIVFLEVGARVSHWTQRPQVWQDCLASKSLGSTCIHLLSSGIIGMDYHAWLFLWVLRLGLGFSCCMTNTLLIESSPQSQELFILK